jgi:prepilin-type processing-associated H-X9-DG protein
LLAFVAFLSPQITVGQAGEVLLRNYALADGHVAAGLTCYLISGAFLAILFLKLLYGLRARLSMKRLVLSGFLGGAVASFCGLHTLSSVAKSLAGNRVPFNPTGANAPHPPGAGVHAIIASMALPWLIYLVITIRLWMNPGLFVFGLNLVWAAVIVASPVILWLFHRDRAAG